MPNRSGLPWIQQTPIAQAWLSRELARTQVYGSLIADPCAAPAPARVAMDEAKIEQLIPVLRLQVAKGGIRLARLLDEALDGNHPEVAHPPKPKRS